MPVKKGENVYGRATKLVPKADENFLELGRLLYRLQEETPDDFRKLIKNSKLGQRKAYYLIDIHKALQNLDIDEARLKGIGWTKLSLMAAYITAANAAELLRLAEENTTRDLQLYLRGQTPPESSHCVLMYLKPEDYVVFAQALAAHGATPSTRGLYDKEEALMRILRRVVAEGWEAQDGPKADAPRRRGRAGVAAVA